ncbi:TIGR03621 family F420-dependent LLM class oxidoreductase [Nocardia concava]|uniref:TIGR03621 family F420-dependent LLM class oxidoreductase n=1 Tax=Nocardia concava TaxID=257281 RepID=UPI00031AA6D5|nr:TIGR03621 family F420-dependent LLM class oxidoreductase [Nocardia concava]
MNQRAFRFGASLTASQSRSQWQQAAGEIEALGYDTLLVPDHLGMVAPLPALVSAAAVTDRIRLGTFVLNAGFSRAALLARDVAGVDQLIDGRLELGLGAGFARSEFEAAGLEFPSAGGRIDHLESTVTGLRALLADPDHHPRPVQQRIPLVIAGQGDRLLRLAARHADIVGISGARPGTDPTQKGTLAERVALIRTAAADRFAELELNLMVIGLHVVGTGPADLSLARMFYPDLTDAELLTVPGVLHGTPDQIADTLHRYRETFGITYFTIPGHCAQAFAKVIPHLR